MWLVFFVLGIGLYLITYIKYRDVYQPAGIGILFWFMACSLSSYEPLYNDALQSTLSPEAILSMLLFGICFFFPSLFFFPPRITKQKLEVSFSNKYTWCINILITLTIAAFFIRFNSQLFSPAILFIGLSDLKSSVPNGIPVLHYFDLLTPYVVLVAIFEIYFVKPISKKRIHALIIYCFFSLITLVIYKVSRGELLIVVMGWIYLSYIKFKPSTFKLIKWMLSILLLFMLFTFMRINKESAVVTHLGEGVLASFSPIYTYIVMNFENFNKLTNIPEHDYTVFWVSLKFMLYPFYPEVYDSGSMVNYINTSFFNARTIMYSFYHDLGIFGVAFYAILISLIINWFYYLSVKNIRFVLILAFLQKAIIFAFFGNYFFGELVLLFPYLVALCLLFFSYKKIHLR